VAEGQVAVVSVGDSRAYWIPDTGPAARLTPEDSWAEDAIAAGMPPDAAYADPRAHQITAWIGVDAGILTPHLARHAPAGPGAVVVCSDGLWNYLTRLDEFSETVRAHRRAADSPVAAARRLTDFARAAGGHDNITVAVIPVSV
jgi:serine/threonine protein phosphatase PrpC